MRGVSKDGLGHRRLRPSFEARPRGRAPQDDGGVCGLQLNSYRGLDLPPRRDRRLISSQFCSISASLAQTPALDLTLRCDPVSNSVKAFGPNEDHRPAAERITAKRATICADQFLAASRHRSRCRRNKNCRRIEVCIRRSPSRSSYRTHRRHPEVLAALAGSLEGSPQAHVRPSFEAPRKGAAPQDNGGVCGVPAFSITAWSLHAPPPAG